MQKQNKFLSVESPTVSRGLFYYIGKVLNENFLYDKKRSPKDYIQIF